MGILLQNPLPLRETVFFDGALSLNILLEVVNSTSQDRRHRRLFSIDDLPFKQSPLTISV
jgi:hypothetical protein